MKGFLVASVIAIGAFVTGFASAPDITARSMLVTASAYGASSGWIPDPPKCAPNLCGMESYCACHNVGGGSRCWSTDTDCAVDLKCCVASKDCHGQIKDACAKKTADERKKRDAKGKPK